MIREFQAVRLCIQNVGLKRMRTFVLWDNDGVLVDTEKWYFAATREALAPLDVSLNEMTYLEFMAEGRPCWDLARNKGTSEQEISSQKTQRNLQYQEYLQTESLEIDGVLDVLIELGRTYRMAIVTTARREDFDLIHQSRKMLDYIEFTITREDYANSKPHPDPYLEALRRFDADPAQAIAIEDSARGLQAAHAAGLDCIIVKNRLTSSQDFSKAWKVLDSVQELPTILASQ